jgi:hypothetical protein
MAQIRVERKRSGLTWLWAALIIIVLAIIAWWLLSHNRVSNQPGTAPTSLVAPAPVWRA